MKHTKQKNRDGEMIGVLNKKGFSDRLVEFTENYFDDKAKMYIIKMKYLLKNKDNILKARDEGYSFEDIAKFTTIDFLESEPNLPKTIIIVDKNGHDKEVEVKIYPLNIQNFYERYTDAKI